MNFTNALQLVALAANAAAAKRPDSSPLNDKGGMLRASSHVAAAVEDDFKYHCDWSTEENCGYNDNWELLCSRIDKGGCPCPEGEEKCGANRAWNYAGYCTALCCDIVKDEVCFDDNFQPESCAAKADGGCPCKEGEVKCGAVEKIYAGYCTTTCCDYTKNETLCYDAEFNLSCSNADGECPSNASYDMQEDRIAMFIQAKGTPKEISYFHDLKMKQKILLADGETPVNSAEKLGLEQNEVELFRTIKVREENHSARNEVSFM